MIKSLVSVVVVGALGGAAANYMTTAGSPVAAPMQVAAVKTPYAESTTSRKFGLCSGGVRKTCVVDGDTIWLDGVKIRIADIDTPEVGEPKCASEKALGDKATRRLVQLINAGPFEVQAWEGRDEDKHGRKLRVLVRDGRSLGDVLVAEGLARTWSGRREPWC